MILLSTEMDYIIKLPNVKENSVSNLIILLLTEEWPLSTKGLHRRITRQHARNVSFQSVHKAVKKLQNENILAKTENYYKINSAWLKQIENFSTTINQKYDETETMLKDLP